MASGGNGAVAFHLRALAPDRQPGACQGRRQSRTGWITPAPTQGGLLASSAPTGDCVRPPPRVDHPAPIAGSSKGALQKNRVAKPFGPRFWAIPLQARPLQKTRGIRSKQGGPGGTQHRHAIGGIRSDGESRLKPRAPGQKRAWSLGGGPASGGAGGLWGFDLGAA